jgi:hypothetical protein
MTRHDAMEDAAMPVGPVHHGGYGEAVGYRVDVAALYHVVWNGSFFSRREYQSECEAVSFNSSGNNARRT